MKKASVIIVAGPPASGKTVLANRIAEKLNLPLISKDDIKVQLYQVYKDKHMLDDGLIARASYRILFYLFKSFVMSGTDFVVESNFDLNISVKEICNIRKFRDFNSLTILCNADISVLYQRFVERDKSDKRAPCLVCKQYHDFQTFYNRQTELNSHLFDIGGEKIVYDTTKFSEDSEAIIMNHIMDFYK